MAGSNKQLASMALLLALLSCVAHTCQASYGFPYPSIPFFKRLPPSAPWLSFDHYVKFMNTPLTCYRAEKIVRDIVEDEVSRDPGIGAGLIRLFFHDCFVQGCDGSVLLDNNTTPYENEPTEKEGIPNKGSLRGFEVIDRIKDALEATPGCKRVVSCADIVAFAARDATFFLSNRAIYFEMPGGRYDGRVSLANETLPNLPPPFADVALLESMFNNKGLTLDEMVTLSGAHSIGISHCSSFGDRRPPNPSDPLAMNSTLASVVESKCISPSGSDTVDQDINSPQVLDNQYYRNVINNEVLFKSDAALNSSEATRKYVEENLSFYMWQEKFKQAMVKMGNIDVKSKDNGEIRNKCRSINY